MHTENFRSLVRRAQAGDPAATERLFRAVLPHVERAAGNTGRLAPGESVSDRVQNVCRRILEKLGQFRGADEAADDEQALALFRGWVRMILRTVTVNTWHGHAEPRAVVSLQATADGDSSSRGSGIDPPSPEKTPSSNVRADERTRLILEALDELPDPRNREIVRLRFFEGLSLHQVADRLQLSYDKVRERYRRSLRRLQRRLEGLQ
jgi:RNA polymerase sigma factor (sigma-70 family)